MLKPCIRTKYGNLCYYHLEKKTIGNKWVYKIKYDSNDKVERYRARLVVKGYALKIGVDFNKIFSANV